MKEKEKKEWKCKTGEKQEKKKMTLRITNLSTDAMDPRVCFNAFACVSPNVLSVCHQMRLLNDLSLILV